MMEEITRNLSESTASSVDAYMATWITLAILAFLLIVVPLFERIPMLKDCISRRWVIVMIRGRFKLCLDLKRESRQLTQHLTLMLPQGN